jgi:ribonuclease P protein component
VIWDISPVEIAFPAQVAISVPKKKFRSAVERNLVKRRIREAYRKNKHLLYSDLTSLGCKIVIIIIFRGEVIPDYESVEKNIAEMNSLLGKRIRKKLKKT